MALLTRERIVDEALHLVERNSHERVSLRALAAELGVTAPALYDHVSSKDAVLELVAARGFEALAERYESVDDNRAIDRVRSRALTYVEFAGDRPELFRLMFLFRPQAVALEADNELAAATTVFNAANVDVGTAVTDGDLRQQDVTRLGLILWASMHGVATVATYAPPVAESLAADIIEALIAGLRPD